MPQDAPLAPPPRTIVVVVADDLGWGDPQCFHPASLIPTPALDRLAREGRRFTQWRTPSALCTPSRHALLTGASHWRTGQQRPLVEPYGPPILDAATPTLPAALRSAGYRTVLVGKWHLGLEYPALGGGWTRSGDDLDAAGTLSGGPLAIGFERFFGTAGCCTSDPPYGFIEDDHFVSDLSDRTPAWLNALPGVVPGPMARDWDVSTVDDTLVDAAIGFLEDHAASGDGPPLFLNVALSAPHNPWVAPSGMEGVSGDGARGDMAAAFDAGVGRLLAAIDRLGLAPDTLLLVTSDHGPQYEQGPSGHRPTGALRGRKNTVWEGGLRVPTVLRWPGRVRPGSTSHVPVLHTDLFPTLAQLVDAPLAPGVAVDGTSQVSAWLGGVDAAERGPVLLECGGATRRIGAWAVLHDDWKLHVPFDDGGVELGARLYHLSRDPTETDDVLTGHPQVARRLRHELERALAGAGWASLSDPVLP